MELGCALMDKLLLSLMKKLFHLSNRNLQDLLIFHVMTRIRFSFLKKMGGISKRKLLGKLEENYKRKRRRCMCNSCTTRALGINP